MLRRPRPGETDEDLLRQEEELVARGELQPSVRLVKADKRKTEDAANSGPENRDAPKSKFAQDRANKKKKEGIKDQTVLLESVRNVPRAAVLGRVVERAAALHPQTPAQWCPQPSPHGFPRPATLHSLTSASGEGFEAGAGKGRVRKSLYMRELERQGLAGMGAAPLPSHWSSAAPPPNAATPPQDPSIAALGNSSVIIRGDGVLRDKSEVNEIHQENLSRLSSMSHEERMREREELLSYLSEDQIAFLRSMRRGGGKATEAGRGGKDDVVPMEVEGDGREEEGGEGRRGNAARETVKKENNEARRSNEVEMGDGGGLTARETVKREAGKTRSSNEVEMTDKTEEEGERDMTARKTVKEENEEARNSNEVGMKDKTKQGNSGGVQTVKKDNNKSKNSNEVQMQDKAKGADTTRALQEGKTVRFKDVDETIRIKTEEKQEETPVPAELPILPDEAKKWMHMDKIELEKLKWMTNVPPPKPLKDNEGFVARFNFEGDVLPYNADISYRQALHHHGEEPGRPGYSLDEIFLMVRSQVLQQRHQGLRMLANIFRNAKEGLYDQCTSPPLIQLAVEAGAVLLLRFALDDPSHLVYSEAVRGLHHLVASQPDELCLALAQPWSPGGLEPGVSSEVHASEKTRRELDKEEQDLKDHEVIKLDVVRALVRMDTLVRLRYLLEKTQPGAETVIHALGLLTRVARHSLSAAWNLASTPRLLAVIMESFLPHNVSPLLSGQSVASMTSVYGVPLRHAVQLLRVLAAKGRQVASLLANTHQVMERLLVYVAMEPSEVSLPLQEALLLSQEAYATWAVLLAYGLIKPVEAVASFYPMFVKQLVFYRDKVPLNLEQENNKFNYDVGAHMLAALTRAVGVAATHSLLDARARLNQGTVAEADGKMVVLQPPPLTWSHLQDLPSLVETCLAKWLTQLARSDSPPTFSGLRLVGSCCLFLVTYYTRWRDQTLYNHEECLSRIEHLYHDIISPFLSSIAFSKLLGALPAHSSLCSSLTLGTSRDPINLGSLGCVTLGGKVVPVIQPSSPFPLLTPFSSLLVTLATLHPGLRRPTPDSLLESTEVASYLEKLCVSPRSLASQWLTRAETYFLCNILQLASISEGVGSVRKVLFHEAALCVLQCIHKGDEHLVKALLTKVVCAQEFTGDLVEMTRGLGDMSLADYEPLKSPALRQPALNPFQMTSNALQSLSSIGSELSSVLVTRKELEASSVLAGAVPFATNSITISHLETPLILDQFWPLTPLKHAFRARQKPQGGQKKEESNQSKPEDILTVTRCLQMAYVGLKHRSRILLPPATTSHSAWLQHLSLAFLSANDLFLDSAISSYLQGCVVELLSKGGYAKMDLQHPIDCFSSTADWYRALVDQYLAVSYGDSTFALFLVAPLQQHCPKDFRTSLWGDASDALQFVYLSPEQVKRFIPLEQFLEPTEEDEGFITKYRAAIGTGIITARRNPLMLAVAEHHARHFLSRSRDTR